MKFDIKVQALLMTGMLLAFSQSALAHGNHCQQNCGKGQHHHGQKAPVKKIITVKHSDGRVVRKVVTKRGNKTIIKKTITHKPRHHRPHQQAYVPQRPAANHVTHSHHGRSHSHPLPASGIHHNHNQGGHTPKPVYHHNTHTQNVVTTHRPIHQPVQHHHANTGATVAKIVAGGLILHGLVNHFEKKSNRKHHKNNNNRRHDGYNNNRRHHNGNRANHRPNRGNRANHRPNRGHRPNRPHRTHRPHVKPHKANREPTFAVYAR